MEESQDQNREVVNATQDIRSVGGLDDDIDLGNQMHSYPKRIDRDGGPKGSKMSNKNYHQSPSVKKNASKRIIQGGYNARSNSTDINTGSNLYKTQNDDASPNHFNSSGFMSNEGSQSNYGGEAKRRIWDGTSQKELLKAMSTYLNKTGAGDYSLPQMTGQKIVEATRRNQPNWSMQSRTKLAWFPGRTVDFQGGYSPASTKYSPGADRDYRNQIFSVGKFGRFHLPSSLANVQKQVPHMYATMNDGLETFKPDNYNFQKVGMGYGTKSDFTNSKQMKQIPGPIYDNHDKNSISYLSGKQNPKTLHGFYNKFDKMEKTCYKGQEQHFYGREGKGPGAYLPTEFVHLSLTKKASQFSVPKNDRGLLSKKYKNVPGPGNYENQRQGINIRNQVQTFAMPRASRDVSFSKYGAQHATLIKKGLF